MIRKIFTLTSIALIILSCKKKDDNATIIPNVTGKWNAVSLRSKTAIGFGTIDTTINLLFGSYVEFKNDGKVYSYVGINGIGYTTDTSEYKVSGNTLTTISSDKMDTSFQTILSISSNSMVLYSKEEESMITQELWANFSK